MAEAVAAADVTGRWLFDTSSGEAGINKAKGLLGGLGDAVGPLLQHFNMLNMGIAGIGAAAMKAGSDASGAFQDVENHIGVTGASLETLEKQMTSMAAKSPEKLGQIGDVLGMVTQRLHLTGDAAQETADKYLKFATAMKLDPGSTADKGIDIQKQWNVGTESLDEYVKAAQTAGVSIPQMMEQLSGKSGAGLRNMGFTFKDSIALFANFKDKGVDAEAMLAKFGIAMDKIGGENPGQALGIALKQIDALMKSGKSDEAFDLTKSIFGARAASEVMSDIKLGALNVDAMATSLQNAKGSVEGLQVDSFTQDLEKLGNQAEMAVLPLGSAFVSVGKDIMTVLGPVLEFFGNVTSFLAGNPFIAKILEMALAFKAIQLAISPVAGMAGAAFAAIQRFAAASVMGNAPASASLMRIPNGIRDSAVSGWQKGVSPAEKAEEAATRGTLSTGANAIGAELEATAAKIETGANAIVTAFEAAAARIAGGADAIVAGEATAGAETAAGAEAIVAGEVTAGAEAATGGEAIVAGEVVAGAEAATAGAAAAGAAAATGIGAIAVGLGTALAGLALAIAPLALALIALDFGVHTVGIAMGKYDRDIANARADGGIAGEVWQRLKIGAGFGKTNDEYAKEDKDAEDKLTAGHIDPAVMAKKANADLAAAKAAGYVDVQDAAKKAKGGDTHAASFLSSIGVDASGKQMTAQDASSAKALTDAQRAAARTQATDNIHMAAEQGTLQAKLGTDAMRQQAALTEVRRRDIGFEAQMDQQAADQHGAQAALLATKDAALQGIVSETRKADIEAQYAQDKARLDEKDKTEQDGLKASIELQKQQFTESMRLQGIEEEIATLRVQGLMAALDLQNQINVSHRAGLQIADSVGAKQNTGAIAVLELQKRNAIEMNALQANDKAWVNASPDEDVKKTRQELATQSETTLTTKQGIAVRNLTEDWAENVLRAQDLQRAWQATLALWPQFQKVSNDAAVEAANVALMTQKMSVAGSESDRATLRSQVADAKAVQEGEEKAYRLHLANDARIAGMREGEAKSLEQNKLTLALGNVEKETNARKAANAAVLETEVEGYAIAAQVRKNLYADVDIANALLTQKSSLAIATQRGALSLASPFLGNYNTAMSGALIDQREGQDAYTLAKTKANTDKAKAMAELAQNLGGGLANTDEEKAAQLARAKANGTFDGLADAITKQLTTAMNAAQAALNENKLKVSLEMNKAQLDEQLRLLSSRFDQNVIFDFPGFKAGMEFMKQTGLFQAPGIASALHGMGTGMDAFPRMSLLDNLPQPALPGVNTIGADTPTLNLNLTTKVENGNIMTTIEQVADQRIRVNWTARQQDAAAAVH